MAIAKDGQDGSIEIFIAVKGHEVRRILRALQLQRSEIDMLILGTPSGPARNALCDVNILLMQTDKTLSELA